MSRVLLVSLAVYCFIVAAFAWTIQFRSQRPVHAPASLAEGDTISEGVSRE